MCDIPKVGDIVLVHLDMTGRIIPGSRCVVVKIWGLDVLGDVAGFTVCPVGGCSPKVRYFGARYRSLTDYLTFVERPKQAPTLQEWIAYYEEAK